MFVEIDALWLPDSVLVVVAASEQGRGVLTSCHIWLYSCRAVVAHRVTFFCIVKSFIHKGLAELHATGRSARVPANLIEHRKLRLDILNKARDFRDLNLPGFGFHYLSGRSRYALSVNGPWRITFEWVKPDAVRVDLEQYH